MVILGPREDGLVLSFNFSEITSPFYFVILVLLIPDHFGVDVVVNNFFAAAVLKVVNPSCVNPLTFNIMMV